MRRIELPPFEEGEGGEMKGEVDGRGLGRRHLLRHRKRHRRRTHRVLRVPAERTVRDGAHALSLPGLGAGAARLDAPEDLHARHVGQVGLHRAIVAADSVEVVEVDRERFHANANLAGPRHGLLDGLERENVGRFSVAMHAPRSHRFSRIRIGMTTPYQPVWYPAKRGQPSWRSRGGADRLGRANRSAPLGLPSPGQLTPGASE